MKTNTQKLLIYQDGQLTNEYDPSLKVKISNVVSETLIGLARTIRIHVSMYLFDIRHRTHYRQIRRQLMIEKKQRDFESKIGLIRL